MTRCLRILFAAALVALLLPTATSARNQGELAVTADSQTIKTFPAFTAAKPPPASAVVLQTITPSACTSTSSTYCDRIDLNINVPSGYSERYKIHFKLSWDDSGGNSMGLNLWNSASEDEQSPVQADNTVGVQPKTISRLEPTGTMFFTVVNITGSNRGYTTTATWETVPFAGPLLTPSPVPAGGGSTKFTPPTAAPVTEIEDPLFGGFDRPDPTPRVVLVPGEDGQLRAITVRPVKTGNREPKKEPPVDPIVAAVAGVLLLSGAVVGGIAIRNRRRTEIF